MLRDRSLAQEAGRLSRFDLEAAFAAALVIAALVACLAWASVIPYDRAPDESQHFGLAAYIAGHGALPIYDRTPGFFHSHCLSAKGPCVGSYASLPPAAPLLEAAFLKAGALLTGESWDRLVLAARIPSALAIAAFSLLLFLLLRELFDTAAPRLAAAAMGTFIPQVTFIGAYVNDDSLGLAAATFLLYRSLLVLRRGLGGWSAVWTGLALGLVALDKLNYYLVFGVFAVAVLARAAAAPQERIPLLRGLGMAAAVAALLSGWFFIRNLGLYGEPTGSRVIFATFQRLAPDYAAQTLAGQGYTFFDLFTTTTWLGVSFASFWGYFDYLSLPLPEAVYSLLLAGSAACVLGAAAAGIQHLREAALRTVVAWGALVLLLLGAILLSAWTSYTNDYQAQGRYVFAGLPVVAALLGAGIAAWTRSGGYRAVAAGFAIAFILGLNAYAFGWVLLPAYRSWL